MMDLEAYAEERRIEVENKAKIRASLRAKISGQGEAVESVKSPTYEQAKASGSVKSMLAHKLGIYKAQEREENLQKMMSDINIKSIVAELSIVGAKISQAESVLETTIEQYTTELAEDFKRKTKGMPSHSYKYIMLEQQYHDQVEHLQNSDAVRGLKAQIQAVKERRQDLEKVKHKYMTDNEAMIAEAKRQRRMAEIQNSGILDDID